MKELQSLTLNQAEGKIVLNEWEGTNEVNYEIAHKDYNGMLTKLHWSSNKEESIEIFNKLKDIL